MWENIDLGSAAAAAGVLDRAAEALSTSPLRSGSRLELPGRGRVLATGDLHDNPEHLRQLIALARLDASEDRHLVLHEIIHTERLVNGVDLSHRMLVRVAGLIVRYPRQVHLLLANHELAQYTGKGVSKGAGNSVALFDEGLDFAYGDDADDVRAACRRLIRALPLAAVSAGGLLCAHSLPGPRAGFDPAVLERSLDDDDYRGPPQAGAAYQMVWGRGYTDEQVETLAARWGVKLFCLGHEHVANGIEARGRRVLVLNTDHAYATALPVDLAAVPEAAEAVLSALRLRSVGVAPETLEA